MTDACKGVRLDQNQATPDKQDALCLLSIFDWSKPNKVLTGKDLADAIKAPNTPQDQSAALRRVDAHISTVGHVTGRHLQEDEPDMVSIGDFMMPMARSHMEDDYSVSHEDLEKLTKTP